MANTQERLELIEQSVLSLAKSQSEAIRAQADQAQAEAMEQVENQVLTELYSRMQDEISEIRGSAVRGVSQSEEDLRRRLLRRREEITAEVFGRVEARLQEYAKTPDYREFMLELAASLGKQFPHEGSLLQIRGADIAMVGALTKAYGHNCSVEATDTVAIGGIRLVNTATGILVDETLDARLAEQHPWFYTHSDMTLD